MNTATSEIERLLVVMETSMEDNTKLAQENAEAEVAYRVAYAKALLVSEQSTDARRAADATAKCERYLGERKRAEAVYNASCERLRGIRASLDSLRTLCANERTITR